MGESWDLLEDNLVANALLGDNEGFEINNEEEHIDFLVGEGEEEGEGEREW